MLDKGTLPKAHSNPSTAAILSFPGSGQVYQRQVGAGLGCLVIAVIGYVLQIIPGLVFRFLYICGLKATATYSLKMRENRRVKQRRNFNRDCNSDSSWMVT